MILFIPLFPRSATPLAVEAIPLPTALTPLETVVLIFPNSSEAPLSNRVPRLSATALVFEMGATGLEFAMGTLDLGSMVLGAGGAGGTGGGSLGARP